MNTIISNTPINWDHHFTECLMELRTYTIYWNHDETPDNVERGCWALKGMEEHWGADPRRTNLNWKCECLYELWEEDNFHNTA